MRCFRTSRQHERILMTDRSVGLSAGEGGGGGGRGDPGEHVTTPHRKTRVLTHKTAPQAGIEPRIQNYSRFRFCPDL